MAKVVYAIGAALALGLAACTPAAQNAPPAPTAPQPSPEMQATFKGCTWGEVKGGGLSIWSFACPTDKLVGDDALPGFQREASDGAGGLSRYPAIRVFAKAADAPVESVLGAVRAAAPWPEANTCAFEPAPGGGYHLMPTGATREAWDAYVSGKSTKDPGLPCGVLGPTEAGDRVFKVLDGAPDKVVLIELGSEIQTFDISTLTVAK